MGSIILCHKKKARKPYEIARIHRRIYTIEELCYYLCNHLYLVDYTIMNEKLCDWLEQELQLSELAIVLRKNLKQNGSLEHFVSSILMYSSIYNAVEMKQIESLLDKLKNQKPIEKQKYKADNLMENGAYQAAILIYQSILHDEMDDSVDKKFYGRVYACLGGAYGKLFLYEEAAKMYETAFQICEEQSMVKAYLYACYRYMSKYEYMELLQRSQVYRNLHMTIQEEMQALEKQVGFSLREDTLDKWKEQYRRSGLRES